ncbi:MAG: DUF3604 domain-containing protein [Spirochaetales bacterium]|nr:DUF3604 domain-containing protein [Spirochaetales bacterium]
MGQCECILLGILIIAVLLFLLPGCHVQLSEEEILVIQTESISIDTPATVYYGMLHNHSNYSDGKGSPDDAYRYARDTVGLDFFGLSDHAERLTDKEWKSLINTAGRYNQDGVFVAFSGFEWSHNTYGHVTVTNTEDICRANESGTDTFYGLVGWLEERGHSFF